VHAIISRGDTPSSWNVPVVLFVCVQGTAAPQEAVFMQYFHVATRLQFLGCTGGIFKYSSTVLYVR
jgi:hypothetical protein